MPGFQLSQKQLTCNTLQEMPACWRLLEKTEAEITRPECYTSFWEWLWGKGKERKHFFLHITQTPLQVHCPEQVAFAKGISNDPISNGIPLAKPGTHNQTHKKLYHCHLITDLSWISKQAQNVNDVESALVAACQLWKVHKLPGQSKVWRAGQKEAGMPTVKMHTIWKYQSIHKEGTRHIRSMLICWKALAFTMFFFMAGNIIRQVLRTVRLIQKCTKQW